VHPGANTGDNAPVTGSPAPSSQPADPSAHGGMLRHGWVGVAQVVAVAAIAVGALAAIYAGRSTVREGLVALRYVRIGWLLAGVTVEIVSMAALAQLERSLLRGAGASHTPRSVLATAYSSNAISVTVPIIGSSIATAYAYRDLRRAGARAEHVSMALTVAGVFSTVAFAVIAATGALITGNTAAAATSLAGSFLLAAAVAAIVVATRFPRARTWLTGRVSVAVRLSKRVINRPKGEPRSVVTSALDRVAALHLGYGTAAGAFGWALVNWIADVACLVCAIKAVAEPIPWAAILIVWTAGIGAASFSPVPAGLGIVDIVLIAALAAAGLHGTDAVAAALVYRSISLKVLTTVVWLTYHQAAGRRQRYAPQSAPSSHRSTAPLRHASAAMAARLVSHADPTAGMTAHDQRGRLSAAPTSIDGAHPAPLAVSHGERGRLGGAADGAACRVSAAGGCGSGRGDHHSGASDGGDRR
jgi:putative heme transporter